MARICDGKGANTAPAAATDELATAALIRASDYIRFPLRGEPDGRVRPLTFMPPGYELPLVVEAAYIAASFELATPGFFSRTYTASEQKVLTEVKGIKWTVTGDSTKPMLPCLRQR